MNKQQAQQIIRARQIIRDTFENPFDKQRFIKFTRDFLNHFKEDTFIHRGYNIPDSYDEYISSWQRLGKYSDGENRIDILIVNLKKETSLERARSRQRNFVAGYLQGKYGRSSEKEAALVAYVSPNKIDWRFSLVKMDYKFEKTKTGRMKVKEEFTPARRWSFLVGANEKSHTAQSRLVNILKNDEQSPTLEEIEKAFDIETVTKEFFLKYRELFLRTKEELDGVVKKDPKIKADFDDKGIDTVNFAKKLLGQIVFLYFLQKKGWFGVGRDDDWGTGSKNFLRELYEKKHGDYKNFFNDILEPLFYEALRTGQDREYVDYYYSRFDCKIPFLNGGLFDPIGNYDWVHTDIIIPDKLFSNTRKTREGDTGDGILDIFDRYNFTVKEDEPLEKEVAIDPELLGKAYEKFNAIRPDNYDEFRKALKSGKKGEENKFNKKFGVYYTPREIVHYMCQQSLINYLATELEGKLAKEDIEALIHTGEQVSENEVTALLKEKLISEGKQKTTKNKPVLSESIKNNADLIDDKLAEITVCDPAVGSGAFPVGMMSEILKVRNVLSVFLNDKGRTSYDFKRRCIEHSLYGVDIDPGAVEIAKLRLWLSLVVDEDDIKNIKPLPNLDYKIVCGNSLLGVERNLLNDYLFQDLEKLKPLHFNETNPTKKQEYKKQIDELISQITNGHKEFDFEVYFSEVFHEKASPEHSRGGGFDVVIANPPYVQLSKVKGVADWYKAYLRNRFRTSGGRLNTFIFFTHLGLELLKKCGNLAFIIPNTILTQEYYRATREHLLKNNCLKTIVQYTELPFENAVVENVSIIVIKGKFSKYSIDILVDNLSDMDLVDRKQNTEFLSNPNFSISVNTDALINKVFNDYKQTLGEFCEINQAIALKGDRTLSLRTSNPDGKYYKKLDGKNIGRYWIKWDGVYLDYKLRRIHSCKRKDIFQSKEKLFFRRVSENLIFAYDDEQHFALNTLVVVNLKKTASLNLKYVLAIVNSRLINYIYKKKFKSTKKVFSEIQTRTVKQLPIAYVNYITQAPLITLVEHILGITKDEDYIQNSQKQTKVKALEAEIDQHVYKLYDLTPEEIKIVENS